MAAERVSSSFRDPAGFVLQEGDNAVLRVLSADGKKNYTTAVSCGLIKELTDTGSLLPVEPVIGRSAVELGGEQEGCVLTQQRLPFVSYPYEWCFDELKAAALLHLDIQRMALQHGFELSDATAYNIQFIGHRPFFIDIGSFVPRSVAGYWRGYRQFCEQFLNPLLLQSVVGVPFNDWYRGRVRGISTEQIAPMLRWPKRMTPRIYLHVILHARMIERTHADGVEAEKGKMSDVQMDYFLGSLRDWISSLSLPSRGAPWVDYTRTRTYASAEVARKFDFVSKWTTAWHPDAVLDLGTNTGEAAFLAASLKANHVIGVEQDPISANVAYCHARQRNLPVLPLVMNLTNPSPAQGWQNKEWLSFYDRNRANVVYALAILHHLVLGDGIPLDQAVARIVSMGRRGIIEFVPPEDPMALSISNRVRNYAVDYSMDSFIAALKRCANLVGQEVVTGTGRCVFAYERDE